MTMLRILRKAVTAAKKTVLENIAHSAEITGTENPFGDKTLILDEKAEKVIIEILTSTSVPLNILSEELGMLELHKKPEFLAVIDPIDGSANLERGIPLCSVGISLIPFANKMHMDDVEISIVQSLFTDEIYEAVKGKGVTKNGKPVKVAAERSISQAIISYDTKKTWDSKFIEASARVIAKVKDMRRSATNLLDLCWVALGALDAMVDLRDILPIVHIMGTHMVKEAGGVVLDVNGNDLNLPINMEKRMSFVAASTRKLAKEILNAFQG